VNIKEYAGQGHVGVYPGKGEVRIEVDKCTVFADRVEALSICAALIEAGHKTWGREFLDILLIRFGDQ
jgi:hypothetical protein